MRFVTKRSAAGRRSLALARTISGLGLAAVLAGTAVAQDAGMDPQAYQRALDQKSRMRPAEHLMRRLNGGGGRSRGTNISYSQNTWESMGATYMAPRFQRQQGAATTYVAGRVNAVAWDNRRVGTMYVASAAGGVWKSEDYGNTWNPLSDFTFPVLNTSAIALDPVNTRILYVGLGDFAGFGDFHGAGGNALNFTNAKSTGIMKSFNGGKTWVNVGKEMAGFAVSAIVVDPDNPRILVATTGRGTSAGRIWRSTDGGTSWTNVTPAGATGDWSGVHVFNPYNVPRTVGRRSYFATCLGNGVYRSDDRGATWVRINAPLRFNVAGQPNGYNLKAVPSAVNPNVVYVMDGNAASSDGRIFKGTRKTLAGADTYEWVEITGNYPTNDGIFNNWFRGDYANALAVAPVSVDFRPTDLLYAANSTLSFSVGGTASWTDAAGALGAGARVHIEQHDIRYNPFQPTEQLLANDGGVYGVTFDNNSNPQVEYDGSLNGSLVITQLNGAAFDPDNIEKMVGGTPTIGAVQRTASGWSAFAFGNPPVANIGKTAINPGFTHLQYVVAAGGDVYYTRDAWATIEDVTPRQVFPGFYNVPFDFTTNAAVVNAWNNQAPSLYPPIVIDPALAVVNSQNVPNEDPARAVQVNPAYTGRTFLWRHDPPPANAFSGSDNDFPSVVGQWRQVGNQQLTTAGTISAIAVTNGGNRIFVGTTDGQLWVTSSVGGFDSGRAEDLSGNLIAAWRNIRTGTLPQRPITSISVNPLNAGDILVTLGGTGGGHVFRCQDVTANNIVYTDQSGLADNTEIGYTRLPDVPVYALVRDPADPINTWFVASEIGVFTTTDKGSTWTDAGTPLRLPLAPVTSLEISPRTGFLTAATYGRGAWKFDMRNLVEVRNEPQLSVSYTLGRSGNKLFAVVTLRNAESTPGNPVGPAENVNLTGSSITVGVTNANTETPVPVDLTTIGVGKTKSTALQFPASVGPSGSSAILRVNYSYRFNEQTITKTYSVRTRLP